MEPPWRIRLDGRRRIWRRLEMRKVVRGITGRPQFAGCRSESVFFLSLSLTSCILRRVSSGGFPPRVPGGAGYKLLSKRQNSVAGTHFSVRQKEPVCRTHGAGVQNRGQVESSGTHHGFEVHRGEDPDDCTPLAVSSSPGVP